MNIIRTICIVTCFCILQKIEGNQIISFFMRSYYTAFPDENKSKLYDRLKRPGKIALHTIENIVDYQIIKGIAATYAGYLDVSDSQGQITFPRKHNTPFVYLLITPQIEPVTMFANTIHHWIMKPELPIAFYKIEYITNTEEGKPLWRTTTQEIPNDHIIPLETITLLTEPSHIYIDVQDQIAQETQNLCLPDIYVKKGLHIVNDALFLVTISHLLRPTRNVYKTEPLFYESSIKN